MANRMNSLELKTNSLLPKDQEIGLALCKLEDALANNRETAAQPQRNDFYLVAWVSTGNGITEVDGKSYHYGPNTVFIVQPGQVMRNSHNEGTRGTAICFNESFLIDTHRENILLQYGLLYEAYGQLCYQLDGKAAPVLCNRIDELRAECDHSPSVFGHRMALYHHFKLILITIQRAIPNNGGLTMDVTNPNHTLFICFRHLLEEHFKEGWKVWQYAKQLGVSEKILTNAVRVTRGFTPAAIMRDRSITEAKRLLQYSDLSISSIALTLGGMDQSNFNNYFRTATGETPNEYRKRMKRPAFDNTR